MRINGRRLTILAAFLAFTFMLTLKAWSVSPKQSVSPQEANRQETTPQNDVPILDLKQVEEWI